MMIAHHLLREAGRPVRIVRGDEPLPPAEELGALADYLVVNVSSPNTPGLRALQGRAPLEDLLGTVRAELGRLPKDLRPPLVLKISPDLMPEDLADIAAVALSGGMEGIAIGNTTIDRPATLMSRHRYEAGGLSGRPLLEPSTRLLGETFRLTEGNIPLIGIGGVDSGEAAYRKIRAGASLVQLYTALIFEGPLLVGRIKSDLSALLHRDDFTSVAAAVGCDHRKKTGA